MWEDIETEAESDDSIEDMAAQEFEGDSSEDDISPETFSASGPTTVSRRNARSRRQHVEYNWEEINDGKLDCFTHT